MRRIFIVFLKQMSLAQQTLALLRKVRDKKFCCFSLRHQRMTRKNLLPKWQRCADSLQGLPTPAYPKVKDCQQQHPFYQGQRCNDPPLTKTHFLIEFFLEGKLF